MKNPASISLSASGKDPSALKNAAGAYLVSRHGAHRKSGTLYELDDLTAAETPRLITGIYEVERRFRPETILREVSIQARRNINFRNRSTEPRPR